MERGRRGWREVGEGGEIGEETKVGEGGGGGVEARDGSIKGY